MEYKVNKDYIEKIKHDLSVLRKNLIKMDAWEIEIGVLEEKISSYKNNIFNAGGQSNSIITIDDIVDRDETRLNTLKSNIDHTNYKLKEYKAALHCLDDDECEVINKRYLNVEGKSSSYNKISKTMHCSHTTIKRINDSAIEKIAEYKYGSIGIA